MSVICPEEFFLVGQLAPNFAHDPRLPQLLIYVGINVYFSIINTHRDLCDGFH